MPALPDGAPGHPGLTAARAEGRLATPVADHQKTADHAAQVREVQEETALDVLSLDLVGVYDFQRCLLYTSRCV